MMNTSSIAHKLINLEFSIRETGGTPIQFPVIDSKTDLLNTHRSMNSTRNITSVIESN